MAKANSKDPRKKQKDWSKDLYEGVLTCQPALAPALLDEVAAAVMDNQQLGIPWRITTLLATKGGDFYKAVTEDAEQAKVWAEVIPGLQAFTTRLETMLAFSKCVQARLMVSGCAHEDFNKWLKEAEEAPV